MVETNLIEATISSGDGDTVVAATKAGNFTAIRPARETKAGDACLLSIRPESWKLSSQNSPVNAFSGRLGERVYLGEMAQYEFFAGPQKLKIYELNPRFVDASGDKALFASVDPQDVIVLEPAPGGR